MVDIRCDCWDYMLNEMRWPAPVAATVQEYAHEIMSVAACKCIRLMHITVDAYGSNTYYAYDDPFIMHPVIYMYIPFGELPHISIKIVDKWNDELWCELAAIKITYTPVSDLTMQCEFYIDIDSFAQMCDAFDPCNIHKFWDMFASAGVAMPDVFRDACARLRKIMNDTRVRANHMQVARQIVEHAEADAPE